jgi:hypothetical protein
MLRLPHAHAAIERIDAAAARAATGGHRQLVVDAIAAGAMGWVTTVGEHAYVAMARAGDLIPYGECLIGLPLSKP